MEVIVMALITAIAAGIAPTILALNARITAKASAKLALAAADDARVASDESTKTNVILAGNGHGNVPFMLEHLMDWTKTHDARHLQVDARVERLDMAAQFLTRGTLTTKDVERG